MEDKLKYLNKLLKVIESRNELLEEEIKRNEENIKNIENEISVILETLNDSSIQANNVDVKIA